MHIHRFLITLLSLFIFSGCGNLELASIDSPLNKSSGSKISNFRSDTNDATTYSGTEISDDEEPLNIILLIGDGDGFELSFCESLLRDG